MPDTTSHMSISLDGFVAGPDQSRENPLGKGGREVHTWHLGDERANDANATAERWLMRPRGAYVMGRNMFGPIRGEWDEDWDGWWGPEPPYHAPVFVLTHHAREPIEMEGGTSFHFVTQGFEAAYAQACEAAGEDGVDIAGGASTVRQALAAGVIDELTRRRPRPARLRRAPVRRGRVLRVRAGRGAPLPPRHAHPLPGREVTHVAVGPKPARPLRYSINVTLDGCCDHRAGSPDAETHRHATETLEQADALLFGRVTYEMMESAWRPPGQLDAMPEWTAPFARTIDAAKKYVVSGTLEQVDWNAELLRGDLEMAVRELKSEPGNGLYVGGLQLPLALAELGLIDEYEFIVHPRLAGHGPTLFAGLPKAIDLKLVGRLEFGSGAVALRYEPRAA